MWTIDAIVLFGPPFASVLSGLAFCWAAFYARRVGALIAAYALALMFFSLGMGFLYLPY